MFVLSSSLCPLALVRPMNLLKESRPLVFLNHQSRLLLLYSKISGEMFRTVQETFLSLAHLTHCFIASIQIPDSKKQYIYGSRQLLKANGLFLSVPCAPGTYSQTGVEPCLPCARGTYQSAKKQTSCLRCDGSKSTYGEGASSTSQCVGELYPRQMEATRI